MLSLLDIFYIGELSCETVPELTIIFKVFLIVLSGVLTKRFGVGLNIVSFVYVEMEL
jgi:hypothetical protein